MPAASSASAHSATASAAPPTSTRSTPAAAPAPAAAKLSLHQFLSSPDNIHIRYGVYGPAKQTTEPFILFLLGRGEWIEKYEFLYQQLYAHHRRRVVIVDHLGQGGSGGVPSHTESYNDYTDLIKQLLDGGFRRQSYAIIAHSMGGLIALYGTLTGAFKPTRIVLASPLIGLPQKPVPRLIARPLSGLLTRAGLGGLSSGVKLETSYAFHKNRLTSDNEKYQLLRRTPYAIPAPTMAWVKASFAACELIHYDRYLMTLSVPVLVMYGSDEEVVSAQSIIRWCRIARRLSTSTLNLVCIPGAKHELFFESDAIFATVLAKTKSFLNRESATSQPPRKQRTGRRRGKAQAQ